MGCRRNSTKSYRVLCLKTGTVSSVNFFKANWPEVICRVLFWMPCLSALGILSRIRGASKEIGGAQMPTEKQVRRVVVSGHLWWMTTWHQDGSGQLRDVLPPRLKWSKWWWRKTGCWDLLRIDVNMEKSGWDSGWLKLFFLEIFHGGDGVLENSVPPRWVMSNGGDDEVGSTDAGDSAVKTRGRFGKKSIPPVSRKTHWKVHDL